MTDCKNNPGKNMKKSFELTIHQPIDVVWQAFSNPYYLKYWQPNLQNYQHQSGSVGSVGATSRLKYVELGQEICMTETILANQPMSEFSAVYTSRFGNSVMRHFFLSADSVHTCWKIDVQFEWQGLLGKLVGSFAQETMQKRFGHDFTQFKNFVENYDWR